MTQILAQFAWLATESLVVAGVLLLLFRLRPWFGHSLLYLTLGSFQYLQTYLAVTASVEVVPGLVVNPGSAVLFTATLFTILLIYISEDLEETRRLIYGIVLANIIVTLVSALFSFHMASTSDAAMAVTGANPQIFQYARLLVVGTFILLIDVVITILAYTWLRRHTRYRFVQILAALSCALLVDSALFVSFNFWDQPGYRAILASSIVGKLTAALFCSALMATYLRKQADPSAVQEGFGSLVETFRLLTYNAPIDELRARLNTDGLTGVFNRSFFDRQLEREVGNVGDTGKPLSLLMVDLDHFKQVNDNYGHQAGDDLLRMVGQALVEGTRATDFVCRYGGEEFSIILPAASKQVAIMVAEKVRDLIASIDTQQAGLDRAITTTIGLAECPQDATTSNQLVRIADTRLYEGKRAGRNRVASGND